MAVTMYGIKNCDTIKKARAWLDEHRVEYMFHDYKVAGIDRDTLEGWLRRVGWEVLCNRAGTTFRTLPEAARQDLDRAKAVALMIAHPSAIKRPVLDVDGRLLVGFSTEQYQNELNGRRQEPVVEVPRGTETGAGCIARRMQRDFHHGLQGSQRSASPQATPWSGSAWESTPEASPPGVAVGLNAPAAAARLRNAQAWRKRLGVEPSLPARAGSNRF